MSVFVTVASRRAIEARARQQPPRCLPRGSLSRAGFVYLAVVTAAAVGVAVPFLAKLNAPTLPWITFLLLGASAATAQLFVVHTPRNQSYQTTVVFLVAAALLLPPELLALMGVVQYLPEWLKTRRTWHVQCFNICNSTLDVLASSWAFRAVIHWHAIGNQELSYAFAGVGAIAAWVAVNHLLISCMIRYTSGLPLQETGLFSFESLSTDAVLAALGLGLAAIWTTNVWLTPFAVAPLLLIHRSLSVPQLQAEARVDPKTGLFNARYFASALADELGRAIRFERPMSLIMADLDLLRDINNAYGHLAGDAVLKGVAQVFRAQLRHYDVPARFGGEEFSIILPETPPEQALEVADRVRRAVAERSFEVETSSEPIRATVSIGVAGYPQDGVDPSELIHQADLAVYRAKRQGRNRVLGAGTEYTSASTAPVTPNA